LETSIHPRVEIRLFANPSFRYTDYNRGIICGRLLPKRTIHEGIEIGEYGMLVKQYIDTHKYI